MKKYTNKTAWYIMDFINENILSMLKYTDRYYLKLDWLKVTLS